MVTSANQTLTDLPQNGTLNQCLGKEEIVCRVMHDYAHAFNVLSRLCDMATELCCNTTDEHDAFASVEKGRALVCLMILFLLFCSGPNNQIAPNITDG